MRTLPLTVLVAVLLLQGCGNRQYQAVPRCEPSSPPKGSQYTNATPDEKLVLMTTAYIRQTRVISDCNENIGLINAANKAVVR